MCKLTLILTLSMALQGCFVGSIAKSNYSAPGVYSSERSYEKMKQRQDDNFNRKVRRTIND